MIETMPNDPANSQFKWKCRFMAILANNQLNSFELLNYMCFSFAMPFAFRELNCRAFLFALLFHSTLSAHPRAALPAILLFCEMISQAVSVVIRKMYEWTRVPQTNEKKKLFENAFSSINFKQYINFTFILFSSIIHKYVLHSNKTVLFFSAKMNENMLNWRKEIEKLKLNAHVRYIAGEAKCLLERLRLHYMLSHKLTRD